MTRVRKPRVDYDGRLLVSAHQRHKPVRVILHDTESHDYAGIRDLEGIARFWSGQGKGYGAHVGVDQEGHSARYVVDSSVAWHTGGRNTGSLGLEMIGFARFLPSVWFLRPRQLHKVARWLAWWSKRWDIPLVIDVEKGISTHRMQSEAFATTNHSDPGAGFPLKMVVWLAKRYKKKGW